jgi:hypothetical protein
MSARGGEERDMNDDDVMIDKDVDYNKNGQDEDEDAVDDDSRGGDDDDDLPKNTSARS